MAQRRLTSGELAQTVPVRMQSLHRWVGHKAKQPIDVVNGGLASTSKPESWATFGQALEWYERHAGEDPTVGVGFVFTSGDGLVFVDLDHAIAEDGSLKGWADSVVSTLRGTYLERSPSGKGLHAFLVGELPRAEGVTGARVQPSGAVGAEKVEVYADRRFSTVTGWKWEGSTDDVEPCDGLSQVLYETGLGERLLRGSAASSSSSGAGDLTPRENGREAAPLETVDRAAVVGALGALDPDCSYEDWLAVGMALKAGLGEDGRELWVEWSSRGSKFQPGEPERKWGSFRRGGVGIGTLFHRALEAGWGGQRDALAEFAGVEVEIPEAGATEREKDRSSGAIPYHVAVFGKGKGRYEAIVRSHENAALYFARDPRWEGRLRLNERTGNVEWNGKPLRDTDLVPLSGALTRALDWSERPASIEMTERAVKHAAQGNKYDPVADWLRGLKWDGVGRMDRLCADVGLEDTDATRRYMRLFLLGAVARALDPGCAMPYVPVLCGGQGLGKSRLAERLAVRREWYHESAVTLGDKDAYLVTLGPWIIELPELAGVRRAEVEKVKAFVSEKESRFRAPYERTTQTHPRRCVFLATTNEEEYNQDASGNRRWLGVGVPGELRLPTESEIEQLWAEAVVAFQRGDRRFENTEEMAETNQRGELRRERDMLEVFAEEVLGELTRAGATTIAEVAAILTERGVHIPGHGQRVIQVALRKAGWAQRKVSVRNRDHRVWAHPGSSRESMAAAVERRRGYTESDH